MIGGSALFVIAIGCIAAGYCVYMSQIFKDIAKEDAREQADRLFDDYIHNCEYRVHTQLRIVDEMHKKSR